MSIVDYVNCWFEVSIKKIIGIENIYDDLRKEILEKNW